MTRLIASGLSSMPGFSDFARLGDLPARPSISRFVASISVMAARPDLLPVLVGPRPAFLGAFLRDDGRHGFPEVIGGRIDHQSP